MGVSVAASGGLRQGAAVPHSRTGLAYAAISLVSCIQLAAYTAGDLPDALLVAGLLALLAALCFSS